MDDDQAIRRMKRGDIGGLESLVTRYQLKAVRAAFLITHDEPMAEDVVQDVFVRVFQRIRGFDESRPFEPYLMRSVVNAALNAHRKHGQRRRRTGEWSAEAWENLLLRGCLCGGPGGIHAVPAGDAGSLARLVPTPAGSGGAKLLSRFERKGNGASLGCRPRHGQMAVECRPHPPARAARNREGPGMNQKKTFNVLDRIARDTSRMTSTYCRGLLPDRERERGPKCIQD